MTKETPRRFLSLLFLVFVAFGCKTQPTVEGSITEVRIVLGTTQTRPSSGVAGAVVGGLVAGTPGAILGGLATRNGVSVVEGTVVACSYIIRVGDREFVAIRESPARCALRRVGDIERPGSADRNFGIGYWRPVSHKT